MQKYTNIIFSLSASMAMCILSGLAHSEQYLDLVEGFGPNKDPNDYFRFLAVEHNRYPEKLVFSIDEERVYSLGRNSVGYYDVVDRELKPAGGWSLTRWPEEYLESEVVRSYGGGYYPGLDNTDMHIADSEKLLDLTGCRGRTPLRYGDVTGDGQPEVVVFVAEQVATDFRVFSTTKNEVIFSTKLNLTDSMHKDSVPDYYKRKPGHQYISRRAVVAGKNPSAAKRAYAKLYIDDFNGNEEPDLLLWRKYYESIDLESEEEGFELKKEKLIHYELVDGEYQTQDTEEAVIEGWLEENELTWQKGYPSKSECEGEEGELIPEMHDPLLNDPDVLR